MGGKRAIVAEQATVRGMKVTMYYGKTTRVAAGKHSGELRRCDGRKVPSPKHFHLTVVEVVYDPESASK
jgi:hypothetical protein